MADEAFPENKKLRTNITAVTKSYTDDIVT